MTEMNKQMTASDPFFQEYTSQDAILKYSRATAGYGISYLLDHDYKRIYLDALRTLPADVRKRGLRMLEFGCGAGMNLVHLTSILKQEGIDIKRAVGTDFSPTLIDAARGEARNYAAPQMRDKLEFYVAMNETLIDDLSTGIGQSRKDLLGTFDLLLGVNTIRYCHRANKEVECAKDIYDLLAPGGICVNIDMNDRFLFFRSSMKRGVSEQKNRAGEAYLPSLQEYAEPFSKVGFEVLKKGYFCWIPHSSSAMMCGILGAASPLFNLVANSRAMRTLVVAKKPLKA